jgi:dipeptidyl aminopeptidase/acylaminoacyl peptidase
VLLISCLVGSAIASVDALLKRPAVRSVTVSPDGQHLAMIRSDAQKDTLLIVKRADMSVTTGVSSPAGTRFLHATWINETRLVVEPGRETPYGDIPNGALVALSVDGSNRQSLLNARQTESDHGSMIVSILPDDPSAILVASEGTCVPPVCTAAESDRPALVRLDVNTGQQTEIARAPNADSRFASGASGQEVLVIGRTATARVQVHRLEDGAWRLVSEFDPATKPGLEPIAIRGPGRAYALANRLDTIGLYDWPLGSSDPTELYRDANADIDRLVFDHGRRQLLAVRTDPGFPSWHYLDEKHPFTGTHQALRAAYPDSDVDVTSFTADNVEAVVRIYSDRNPGDFYIVNTRTRASQLLVKSRPWIEPTTMASMEPFQIPARDGLLLRGYITTPTQGDRPYPLVVIPHDRPNTTRAIWAFNEQVQVLAEAGYAVLQINYRGSAGFGRSYALAGEQRESRGIQRDIQDATRWATSQGIADESRVCLLGEGYGAFAALKAVTENRSMFVCALGRNGIYDLTHNPPLPRATQRGPGYFLTTPSALDFDYPMRAPTQRAERIEATVLLLGDDAQTQAMQSALTEWAVAPETSAPATRAAAQAAMLAFLERNIGGEGTAPAPQGFGESLSSAQTAALQRILARMNEDLDALAKRPPGSPAAVTRQVQRIVDRYEDDIRELVDEEQWGLYPEFRRNLIQRLDRELNVTNVR